jgi:hypothetical protein
MASLSTAFRPGGVSHFLSMLFSFIFSFYIFFAKYLYLALRARLTQESTRNATIHLLSQDIEAGKSCKELFACLNLLAILLARKWINEFLESIMRNNLCK